MIGALRIVEDLTLVETREDWSGVRSRARAERRRRRGFPQRIRIYTAPIETVFQFGDLVVMHPAIAFKLRSNL